jgi:hypothetical protein
MSHVLRFISICDLFTDSPSYYPGICLKELRKPMKNVSQRFEPDTSEYKSTALSLHQHARTNHCQVFIPVPCWCQESAQEPATALEVKTGVARGYER